MLLRGPKAEEPSLSVPTEASWWVDCLKIGQVELTKGPQGVGSGAVLQVVRQGSNQPAYCACNSVSSATASCQRQARLR